MTLEELRDRRWGALMRVADSPGQAVSRLAAVQAQDLTMALLAVALRCPGTRESDILQALDQGHLVRTHAIRPTWHLLAAEDLRWIVGLTGPRVTQVAEPQYRRFGLTDAVRARSRKVLEVALRSGPQPRAVLVAALSEGGFTSGGQPAPLFLMDAEQHLLICSGPGLSEPTYDLVDRRVPFASPMPRGEAVSRLCLRFLQGHGPATVKDIAWWSGLGVKEVRNALHDLGSLVVSDRLKEQALWFDPQGPPLRARGIQWWPAFDESLMGFADRTAFVEARHWGKVATRNGLFLPFVTIDGRVAGTWKLGPSGVEVEWLAKAPKGAEAARQAWGKAWLRFRGQA